MTSSNAIALPRMSRTRKALIESAKRLIASGRMGGATVDDIVRDADVAKGSFYNHFADREALAHTAVEAVQAELVRRIAEATKGCNDLPTYFVRGMLAWFRFGFDDELGARVILNVGPGAADPNAPNHATNLTPYLRRGIESGALKLPSVDVGVVLVVGMADMGLARLMGIKNELERARGLIRDVCVVMLRGLGVDGRSIERVVDEAMREEMDSPSLVSASASGRAHYASGRGTPNQVQRARRAASA